MNEQRAESTAAPVPKAAALFIVLAVKPGTRAQQPNGLVREEAIAMLAGEIGSAVDFTTIRGKQAARRSVNHSGDICHDH